MYYVFGLLIVVAIIFVLLFHWKKKRISKKICEMPYAYKCKLMNEIVEPFGYKYVKRQDMFSSRVDAWQKKYGYGMVYDKLAPYFNMVFDSYPVYFEYDGKTWLIELWKGQYGISMGSEIGVYHSDKIIPPEKYSTTIFLAVEKEEFLELSSLLYAKNRFVSGMSEMHWWQTMFLVGSYANPKKLSLSASIRFLNLEMRDAFVEALCRSGYPCRDIQISCSSVQFAFSFPRKRYGLLKRLFCKIVQAKNFMLCKLYCFVSRPFTTTLDKVLYLYFYIPFVFRRMMRLKRFRKRKYRQE